MPKVTTRNVISNKPRYVIGIIIFAIILFFILNPNVIHFTSEYNIYGEYHIETDDQFIKDEIKEQNVWIGISPSGTVEFHASTAQFGELNYTGTYTLDGDNVNINWHDGGLPNKIQIQQGANRKTYFFISNTKYVHN